MRNWIVKSEFFEEYSVFSVIVLQNRVIARTSEEVIAFSIFNKEILWRRKITGSMPFWLDLLIQSDDLILVFSSDTRNKSIIYTVVDVSGKLISQSESDLIPFANGLLSLKNKVFIYGYKSDSQQQILAELSVKTGKINVLDTFEIGASNFGYSGSVFFYGGKNGLFNNVQHKISNHHILKFLNGNDLDSYFFISESKSKDNLQFLKLNSETFNLTKVFEFPIDRLDKKYLNSCFISHNYFFYFPASQKGIVCIDNKSGKTLWKNGAGEWTGIKAIIDQNELIVLTENKYEENSLKVLSIANGDFLGNIDTQEFSENIFSYGDKGQFLVSGMDGIQFIESN